MTLALSPNQADIQSALRAFLLDVLPGGVEVFEAQDNDVPEPHGANFVVMTPTRRPRLSTNVDSSVDNFFTASIAGTTMTVTAIGQGAVALGALYGDGVAVGTSVVSQSSGPAGGIGTYVVSASQTVPATTMATGGARFEQSTQIDFQLDVHSADLATSSDMAQTISTMLRDPYAVDFFAGLNPAISPLYAEDPRQLPFLNAEQQYESRWVVEAVLQANQVVTGVPQGFAGSLSIQVISVDPTYPPT